MFVAESTVVEMSMENEGSAEEDDTTEKKEKQQAVVK